MVGFLGGLLKGATALGSALFGGGNAAGTLAGIGNVLGGVAGMKQAGEEGPTPRDNLMSQAQGARDAAKEYGFNPLTMLQYGQTGAMAGGGGAAPLASIQLLTDGLKDIGDIASGDAARRRAADQLSLDMAKLKYDQARSGVVMAPASSVNAVGPGPSPLGRRAVTVMQDGSAPARAVPARVGGAIGGLRPLPDVSPADPRREVEHAPITTHSGVVQIDTPWLSAPIYVPTMDGDEPVQWYDLPSLALWGAPAVYKSYLSPDAATRGLGHLADSALGAIGGRKRSKPADLESDLRDAARRFNPSR